jgi:hypothetical protein
MSVVATFSSDSSSRSSATIATTIVRDVLGQLSEGEFPVSRASQHNCRIAHDVWLGDHGSAAIIAFHGGCSMQGYRRLAYLMCDADIAAISPIGVYRVLKTAGTLTARGGKSSRKGRASRSPLRTRKYAKGNAAD